jgi:hypothetical protein
MRTTLSALTVVAAALFGGTAAFGQYGPIDDLKIAKPQDKQDVKSTPAPEGATVLFGGKNLTQMWARKDGGGEPEWELVEGGAMQVKGGDIVTKQTFNEPIHLHVEFRTPYQPGDAGQGRGNSGVYLQGRYEVQVLDSYGKPIEQYEPGDCGCIYGVAKATANASKPPTVWQSYDIQFTPPKFDGDKKVAPGRMTVHHNGVKIHDDVAITVDNTTSGMGGDPKTPGPVMLQDHGNPVQYRNIWVKKLK